MKIVFMGTPEFAVPSLGLLLDSGYSIVGVVTAPDKHAGRGKKLQESAVKKFARERNLNVLQPTNLKDPAFLEHLKALGPDLQIVVAFRMLPEAVWNLPPLGTYNLHASLLPRYRGAAPINRAIMNGDIKTGVTTFKLQHNIDSGNILLQDEEPIGENTDAGDLHDRLMVKGANLLLRTVQLIETQQQTGGGLTFKVQNESEVSHAPKIHKDTCRINWSESAQTIHNQVRGLSPYPAAFTIYDTGEGSTSVIKIYKTIPKVGKYEGTNGTLIAENDSTLHVVCVDGAVQILELQQEGKKSLPTAVFLKGFKWSGKGKFI